MVLKYRDIIESAYYVCTFEKSVRKLIGKLLVIGLSSDRYPDNIVKIWASVSFHSLTVLRGRHGKDFA
jgi:hypothetical protein